jgi:DNA-binding PadR family transcriptional regulator
MQSAALTDPWLLLTSLADGPKHGYAIMTDIAGFSGVHMEPGTLYGALTISGIGQD